jgi:hypothetical protein
MRYKILMHVEIDARDDHQAVDHANKLGELLKNPLVKMAIDGEGIRMIGPPQVYMPQRNGGQ